MSVVEKGLVVVKALPAPADPVQAALVKAIREEG